MADLLIFGASRGTGHQLMTMALKRGDHCVAVVRNQQSAEQLNALGATTLVGDANDPITVHQACLLVGKKATIISTLGGEKANYQAQMNIINQAEKSAIKRMILVTSLGCGDSWSFLSERAKQAFGYSVREKTLAESWLATSSLNYTILRPGGLTDGEPTLQAKCYCDQEVHGYIRRSDLASVILAHIDLAKLDNQAYLVIDPSLADKRNN